MNAPLQQSQAATATVVPKDSTVYYAETVYWNSFDETCARLNQAISGDPATWWGRHVGRRWGNLGRALMLNCGNGWVERGLFQEGTIQSAIGLDIIPQFLAEARAEAERIGMPAEYREADANAADLSGLEFDSVVNHAALHHVAWLDRFLREICRAMPEGGLFVSYDYVGPHRNQYPWESWSRVVELWDALPSHLRSDLFYPHLQTMIVGDPTEAVHSELILETLRRYFEVLEEVPLGGALAYPLLWENRNLLSSARAGTDEGWVGRILDADAEYTAGRMERTLFAYMVCRPRKAALEDEAQLARWTEEEARREAAASANGGRYGPRTALEIVYEQIGQLRLDLHAARQRLAEAEAVVATAPTPVPAPTAMKAEERGLLRRLMGGIRR